MQSADAGKAKIVGMADRMATWVVVIALSAPILTWLFTGEIIRAVTILVVFCPCSLVLATPTAIMAAIGNVTKHGFLVREGDALERLSAVSKITFDKTGTLTYGSLRVTKVETTSDLDENEIFRFAASVEEFTMHPGKGVSGIVDGKMIHAGNKKWISQIDNELNVDVSEYLETGASIIYITVDKKIVGYLVLSDILREESKEMIQKIKNKNVIPVLLTGDNKTAADSIADKLNIDEVLA